MKTKHIIIIVTGMYLLGCNSVDTTEASTEINETMVSIENEEANHSHEHEEIVLNNGSKWEVAPDMLHLIRIMEQGINEFSKNEAPDVADYNNLAVLIDENIISLTSNCTMQGQAHDELHKWLLPFITLSEEFDVAEGLVEQERIYNDFRKSFEVFNTFFE